MCTAPDAVSGGARCRRSPCGSLQLDCSIRHAISAVLRRCRSAREHEPRQLLDDEAEAGLPLTILRPATQRCLPPSTRARRAKHSSSLTVSAHLRRSQTRPLLTHAAIDMVTTKSDMSMRKIRDELGFRPRFTFTRAIEELREQYCAGSSFKQSRIPP